jgi:hypothetical protein
MTMWYDEDEDALVDNRPDHNLDFSSDGKMQFNLEGQSRKRELIKIAEDLKEDINDAE